MADLLVREVDPALVGELEHRAAEHGVSTEDEHRRILTEALRPFTKVKPTLIEFLLAPENEVHPDVELEWDRSKEPESRILGF